MWLVVARCARGVVVGRWQHLFFSKDGRWQHLVLRPVIANRIRCLTSRCSKTTASREGAFVCSSSTLVQLTDYLRPQFGSPGLLPDLVLILARMEWFQVSLKSGQ